MGPYQEQLGVKFLVQGHIDRRNWVLNCKPAINSQSIQIFYLSKNNNTIMSRYSSRRPEFQLLSFSPLTWCVVRNKFWEQVTQTPTMGHEFSQAVCSLLHIMPDSHITYCNILQGNFKQYIVLSFLFIITLKNLKKLTLFMGRTGY